MLIIDTHQSRIFVKWKCNYVSRISFLRIYIYCNGFLFPMSEHIRFHALTVDMPHISFIRKRVN